MPAGKSAAVAQRLKHELRHFVWLAAYLYVCFGALILYKMAILGTQGITYLPLGLPILKALVLAKFMLLGKAIHLGERPGSSRLIHRIAYKALLYLLLLIVLSALEEAILGLVHGRSIAVTIAEVGGDKLAQILATSFIMLLILVPYIAVTEIDSALGDGKLREVLFKNKTARSQTFSAYDRDAGK